MTKFACGILVLQPNATEDHMRCAILVIAFCSFPVLAQAACLITSPSGTVTCAPLNPTDCAIAKGTYVDGPCPK